MKHVDCLLCGGVIGVLKSKSFGDSSRLHFVCVDTEKLRNCAGLICCEHPLSQLNFAQVGLIHFRGGGNNSQGKLFRLSHTAKPFTKPLHGVRGGCF